MDIDNFNPNKNNSTITEHTFPSYGIVNQEGSRLNYELVSWVFTSCHRRKYHHLWNAIYILYGGNFPEYEVEPELDPIIAFKAAYDPDTIYKNQEMQQNDAAKLHKFMQK